MAKYDYSKGGAYFVTICTRNGDPILVNTQKPADTPANPKPDTTLRFELTPIGEIVDRNWRTLPEQFPMVSLDEYVIMPNQFHGIVVIDEWDRSRERDVGKRVGARLNPYRPCAGGFFFRTICPNRTFFYTSTIRGACYGDMMGLKGNPVQIRNSTRCCNPASAIPLMRRFAQNATVPTFRDGKAGKTRESQKTCHIIFLLRE